MNTTTHAGPGLGVVIGGLAVLSCLKGRDRR